MIRHIASVASILLRIAGTVALGLGLLFWTRTMLQLVALHMLAGLLVVLTLWVLAIVAARAGVHRGRVALALIWGLIVPIVGMSQQQLLPGAAHWVIQLIHLLLGIAALGQGEALATQIKQSQAAKQAAISGRASQAR